MHEPFRSSFRLSVVLTCIIYPSAVGCTCAHTFCRRHPLLLPGLLFCCKFALALVRCQGVDKLMGPKNDFATSQIIMRQVWHDERQRGPEHQQQQRKQRSRGQQRVRARHQPHHSNSVMRRLPRITLLVSTATSSSNLKWLEGILAAV